MCYTSCAMSRAVLRDLVLVCRASYCARVTCRMARFMHVECYTACVEPSPLIEYTREGLGTARLSNSDAASTAVATDLCPFMCTFDHMFTSEAAQTEGQTSRTVAKADLLSHKNLLIDLQKASRTYRCSVARERAGSNMK